MSAERQARASERIEHVFAFVQDVLDDPSTLNRIPDKSTIDLTPLERKDPNASYATETRRFAMTVKRSFEPSTTRPRGGAKRWVMHGRVAKKATGNLVYARRASGHPMRDDAQTGVVVHPRERSA
ncbi:MAG TPA: hypothetical protein VM450_02650 [Thermomicrobiales bacterium]|nr:hypothetical protein [Thermomicrobiales bacterium]